MRYEKVFEISVLLSVHWFGSQIQPCNSKQLFSNFCSKFSLFSKYVKLSKECNLSAIGDKNSRFQVRLPMDQIPKEESEEG